VCRHCSEEGVEVDGISSGATPNMRTVAVLAA